MFLGALVFRPIPSVIWGADSEKCIGKTASALVSLDMVEFIKF
jgi:hypothetical protein